MIQLLPFYYSHIFAREAIDCNVLFRKSNYLANAFYIGLPAEKIRNGKYLFAFLDFLSARYGQFAVAAKLHKVHFCQKQLHP